MISDTIVADIARENLVIQKIDIERFRCFKKLELNGLRRINLIVGKNGSGKTALLEGLFLACGASPELYFKTRAWRGISPTAVGFDKAAYEGAFRNLFYRFDTNSVVSISFTAETRGERWLHISFQREGSQSISLPLEHKELKYESTLRSPILFHWKSQEGEHKSIVDISSDEIKFSISNNHYPGVFVTPVSAVGGPDTIQRFSQLSKQRKTGMVIKALQASFPQVEGISTELDSGINVLYAEVRGLDEKIPVGMLSAGIAKYISILLAVLSSRDGVVFVDEIENGLYYDVLPGAMSTILDLCKENNTQVFISTHSVEYLQSLAPLIRRSPDDFTLIRTEQTNGSATAIRFHGDELLNALEQGFDVR